MSGCTFKKYNQRSVSEEYPEHASRARIQCPDSVFLDGRCFTHARIAEQLPEIMDGWKLGKATPFINHAQNGGKNAHKPSTQVGRTGRGNKGRLLPFSVYAQPRSRKNPYRVQVVRNQRIVFSANTPTVEAAVRARDEWLARHGEQG